MNKKICGWKIFFEVIFCSPKDSQLLAPWPSVKCISYIGKNTLQTKIKYVKNLEHVQFFVGRGQVDLGKEQPLCPVGRKLQLFYFSFYNEYASSSSSWQQPEQRIDSCFATVWLSSILLLQVLGSFWNCFLDCSQKIGSWMIYNQPGASSFACPILRPSLALRATKQIFEFPTWSRRFWFCLFFCLPRDRTLAVAGWRREALLRCCQKEHIYPDGKPRTSFCPYEIQWGRTLGPYPGHLSFRSLDLVGTKSRSHSSNLSCSDKLHAMVSANSILICDNKKDV